MDTIQDTISLKNWAKLSQYNKRRCVFPHIIQWQQQNVFVYLLMMIVLTMIKIYIMFLTTNEFPSRKLKSLIFQIKFFFFSRWSLLSGKYFKSSNCRKAAYGVYMFTHNLFIYLNNVKCNVIIYISNVSIWKIYNCEKRISPLTKYH